MTLKQNKAIVDRMWQELFNQGNLDISDEILDQSYAYYGPGGHIIKGPEGFKKFINALRSAIPDTHFTIEDVIAEGDKVVSRWTWRGTHKSTNKQVINRGIVITRIVDGKCVEDYEIYDRLYLAEQAAERWFDRKIIGSVAKRIKKAFA